MKLIEYLDKLNKFRGNKQPISFQDEPIDLKTELYYTIKIDVPGIKVDNTMNSELSSIKVNATLDQFKRLLNKLGIFLMIDKGEEAMTLFEKFEKKNNVEIKLLSTIDYSILFSFELQEQELNVDLQQLQKKFSYVAFFDNKELDSNEKNNISIMLTSKLINVAAKGIENRTNVKDSSKVDLFNVLKKRLDSDFDLNLDDFSSKELSDKEIVDKIDKKVKENKKKTV